MRGVIPLLVSIGCVMSCAGPPLTPTIVSTSTLAATPLGAPTWTPVAEPTAMVTSTPTSASASTCDSAKTEVFIDQHGALMDEWFATEGLISEQKPITEIQPIIEALQDIRGKVSDLDAPCREAEDVVAATRSFMEKEIRAIVATIREDPVAKDLVEEATAALGTVWEYRTELRAQLPAATR
jgi:hypothetical protein